MKQLLQPGVQLGKHALIDLSGCDSEIIRNHRLIQDILVRATDIAKIKILGSIDHFFTPQGYTAVLLLEESHLSIHTWPEHNYISIDLYSCNLQTDFTAVKQFLASEFKATVTSYRLFERGCIENPEKVSVAPEISI